MSEGHQGGAVTGYGAASWRETGRRAARVARQHGLGGKAVLLAAGVLGGVVLASPRAAPRTGPAPVRPHSAPRPAPPAAPAADPASAVATFYAHAGRREFGPAAALWSPRLRELYPPEVLAGRFEATRRLDVQRADVVAVDAAAGTATVAVRIRERGDGPAETRLWTGTWALVRGPDGWLLDRPTLSAGPAR